MHPKRNGDVSEAKRPKLQKHDMSRLGRILNSFSKADFHNMTKKITTDHILKAFSEEFPGDASNTAMDSINGSNPYLLSIKAKRAASKASLEEKRRNIKNKSRIKRRHEKQMEKKALLERINAQIIINSA